MFVCVCVTVCVCPYICKYESTVCDFKLYLFIYFNNSKTSQLLWFIIEYVS